MSNYQNSVIYKIECNDTKIKECYIGSTKDFVRRRYDHKYDCNNSKSKRYNFKVYRFIRNNGGWKNWTMKIIINYQCNSKNELFIKEQEILKSFDNTLNCNSAFRSQKQYYIDNVEKIKQYRTDNAEKIKEKKKQYYIENAEKIKARQNEKIQCECGRLISRCNISKHRKTNKHKSFFSIV